ncbi:hypothetical protein DZ860_20970 [Vibrio sinensis]|uniref:Uncharacterized protein n=1 Tax=Vibrio sinensis TaxID=2302434 RepID=A0A3A6QV99_9VIBR|nr:hypothetical protein DZ860_20970 [Vibrio sinensis]
MYILNSARFEVVWLPHQTMRLQSTQDQLKDQILKFQAQKSRSLAGERLFANAMSLDWKSNTL